MPEIVVGRHAVYHLLKANRRKVHRISLRRRLEREEESLLQLARERRLRISFDEGREITAEADPYPYLPLEGLFSGPRIILLDGLEDPQNLGALCRSAYLLGVSGLVIRRDRAVQVTGAVCRASAGAVEYLLISRITNLTDGIKQLKEKGFWIYGADQSAPKEAFKEVFPPKVAVVLGGEGKGLSHLVRERCDLLIRIPMEGGEIGSFNVSTAGTLILYEIYRQGIEKTVRNP